MGLSVFDKYLGACLFQHKYIEEARPLKWTYEEDEVLLDYHTSYLGSHFIDRLLGKNKNSLFSTISRAEKKKLR